ncbi:MAG: type II secretion system protein [Candidatus Sumerlaeia bacterium]|nr:type II secretion system protein [Candidatus Sumerlaeia bacterium]
MTRYKRGTTLIELLIVVAILAIMSAALLAVVIAPVKEQVVTDLKMEQLDGTTLLLTTMVEDARTASTIKVTESGATVHLFRDEPMEWGVVYHLDDRNVVRRYYQPSQEDVALLLGGDADAPLVASGTPMLSMVHRFAVEQTEDIRFWRVEVESLVNRLHEDHRHARTISLLVGDHRKGDGQ